MLSSKYRIITDGKLFQVQFSHVFEWSAVPTRSGSAEFKTKEEAEAFIAARKAGLPDHSWHVCE